MKQPPPDKPASPPAKPAARKPNHDHPWSQRIRADRARKAAVAAKRPKPKTDPV